MRGHRVTRGGLWAAPLLLLACSQPPAADLGPPSPPDPVAAATAAPATAVTDDKAEIEKALLATHADYAADMAATPDQTPSRYAAYRVDLDDDGRDEVLVYLMGPWFCGTGGCNLEVFAQGEAGYRQVAQFSITQTPVFVGPGRSKGWLDIVRHEAGGGAPSRYVREAFDGKTYTSMGEIDRAAASAGTIAFAENLDLEQAKPLLPEK